MKKDFNNDIPTKTSNDEKNYKYIFIVPTDRTDFLIKVFGLNGKTDIFPVTPEEKEEILQLIKENNGNKFPI